MTCHHSQRYKKLYNVVISRLYDIDLKIGLTLTGENLLRRSFYKALRPNVKNGDHILDLCCGTNTLTTFLKR
ncbi:MAG: hypothetical protein ACFFD7_06935 [Candidatus Thorarchaeota archaeon]